MFTNFKIDQAATFEGLAFLACQPKVNFKTKQQEVTNDDEKLPKWEVQVAAMFRSKFRGMQAEVLKVGFTGHRPPAEGLMPYTPVQLVDFEVGVMEKTKRLESGEEKVIGLQVWYRAAEIRPIAATGGGKRGSEAA